MAIAAGPAPAVVGPFHPLEIEDDRCKGCGLCVDVCPKHSLDLDRSIVNRLGYHPVRLVDEPSCTSCALCARICPDTVFTVFARPKGGAR
jgi:2-oxoglutarate ferredoxin oxidoreductase subunit delta